MEIIKKIAPVIIIAMMLLNFGCTNQKHESQEQMRSENITYDLPSYTLSRENGNWYICMKSENVNSDSSSDIVGEQEEMESLVFESIEDLIQTIKEDSFTEKQKNILSNYCDENNKIEIMNLDRIITPVYAAPFFLSHISWLSYGYCYHLEDTSGNSIKMFALNREAYDDTMSKLYLNFGDNLSIISREKIDNSEIIIASNSIMKLKIVKWNEPDLKAIEIFRIESDSKLVDRVSDTVPYNVYIFREEQGINQWISIRINDRRLSYDELKSLKLTAE